MQIYLKIHSLQKNIIKIIFIKEILTCILFLLQSTHTTNKEIQMKNNEETLSQMLLRLINNIEDLLSEMIAIVGIMKQEIRTKLQDKVEI